MCYHSTPEHVGQNRPRPVRCRAHGLGFGLYVRTQCAMATVRRLIGDACTWMLGPGYLLEEQVRWEPSHLVIANTVFLTKTGYGEQDVERKIQMVANALFVVKPDPRTRSVRFRVSICGRQDIVRTYAHRFIFNCLCQVGPFSEKPVRFRQGGAKFPFRSSPR